MSKQQPSESTTLNMAARFFEKALVIIRPAYMKLLVVLIFAMLLAFFIFRDYTDRNLGLVLFVVVVMLFACLTAVLEYTKIKLRYINITVAELKGEFRDAVMEQQEKELARTAPRSKRQ